MGILWGFTNTKPFWQWSEFDTFGHSAKSGVIVNNHNALTTSAYYAGVTLIAKTLGQVPLPLYKRLARGKEKAYNHPLYSVLHDEPNPYMDAMVFRETLQGHILTWGNAFAEIEWEGDVVRHLWPLKPNSMQVGWKEGKLFYIYTTSSGERITLSNRQILHIPGFGFDGIIGYDPITLAREALGLSKATEEFGARFFANGSQLSGIITHPNTLSENAKTGMRKSWEDMHKGLSSQHRVAILEEGVSFQSIGVPPENAQYLETRKFQLAEVARFLNIPPHMLGDLDRATFSNIEHMSLEFVVYTMTQWFVRWEQAIRRKCLSLADKREYFAEFLITGLLRGDSQSRAAYYKERFFMGSLSPNDIREKENENPIPGGDEYYIPLNMLPVSQAGQLPSGDKSFGRIETKGKQAGLIRSRTSQLYRPMFEQAGQKIVKAEIKAIKEAAKKHLSTKAQSDWFNWLDKFYADFGDTIKEYISPAVHSLAEEIQTLALQEVNFDQREDLSQFLERYSAQFTARYIDSSKGQLKFIADEAIKNNEDTLEVTMTRLDEWGERRPGKVSMNETVQLANAVAKASFVSAGITKLVWQNVGSETCPYCEELDGRVMGIERNFVDYGTSLEAEGTDRGMQIYKPCSYPPLHQGCVCVISAA